MLKDKEEDLKSVLKDKDNVDAASIDALAEL